MSSHLRGVLMLVLVTAIWGSTFAVVKELGQWLAPAALIAWRFSIGALALLPLYLWSRHTQTRRSATPAPTQAAPVPLWKDALVMVGWLMAGYGTQTMALQTASANRTAFFTALSVVLVPLWLALAQRRRLPVALWLALPLAVTGLGLLSWEGGQWVIGDALALLCALCYAGFILALEQRAGRQDPLAFTFAQVLGVSVVAWVWAWASGAAQFGQWPVQAAWGPLLYLGIAATMVTTLLQTLGQRHVNAAEASLIYALEPVAATVFSYFLLHEQVGTRGALGGLLVVIATVFASRAEAQLPKSAP